MSTADLSSLQALLERSPHGKDPAAGPLLQRISKDLAGRRVTGSHESADTFRRAATLLPRIAGTMHGEARISGLLDCYRFFYESGDFPRALSSSVAMHSLSDRMARLDDVSLAKNLEGIALTELGDVGKALVSYATALEIAERLRNLPRQSSILGNTGMALNSVGLYSGAISCLKRSIAIDGPHAMPHACNLAQSYLELGEFELGLEAIELSIRARPEPDDPLSALSRCVAEFTFAELALAIDDVDLARAHSDMCLRYSTSAPRGSYLGRIAIARCDVRSGCQKRGINALLRTLSECEGRLSHVVDCLAALVKVYDETGDPDKALGYLTRLLELIKQARANSVEGLLNWSLELEGEAPVRLMLQESSLKARAAEKRTEAVTIEMLERLAVTADIKDDNSGEHGCRVGTLSRLLAEALGWKSSHAGELERAARLHDIGKIIIPDSILRQSTPLQDRARAFLQSHCEAGAEILARSSMPSLRVAESVARNHHEAWDGSGYPRGLKGTQIPVGGRIVAITDAFDALTHDRSYSPAWSCERAIEAISEGSGTRFDPALVTVFREVVSRLTDRFGAIDSALQANSQSHSISTARRRIHRIVAATSP
jgi:putative two-component system response regulator